VKFSIGNLSVSRELQKPGNDLVSDTNSHMWSGSRQGWFVGG